MSKQTVLRPASEQPGPPNRSSLGMEAPGIPPDQQEELISNIRKTSMEWVSQIGQMQRFDLEFATRLARCIEPSEAVALCGEWMGHRIDSAVAMQHRLLELWLDAMTASTRLKLEAGMPRGGNGDAGTEGGPFSGV
jgi:hypothetical protein